MKEEHVPVDNTRHSFSRKRTRYSRKGVCEIEGCSEPIKSRRMCEKHYARWRRHGDPNKVLKVFDYTECQVIGCEDSVYSSGYCKKHYGRFYRHGNPLVQKHQKNTEECIIDGCSMVPISKNMCSKHYHREYQRKRRKRI